MDIHEKIKSGYYQTKLPSVRSRTDPEGAKAFRADQTRLDTEFRKDALAHAGFENHPRKEDIYMYASDSSNGSGYQDVVYILEELAATFGTGTSVDFDAPGPVLSKAGPEPSLRQVLRIYYSHHGVEPDAAEEHADRYIRALKA